MSIAALGYEIDSSQALTAERNLDRMNDAAGRAGAGAGGLEKQSVSLSAVLKRMKPIVAGLTASLGAVFGARALINAAEQYETRMARVNAVIQATGGVAGRTAEQLERQAQSLARATLESVDGVMQAQQVLLTFRNIQGDVFDRAIESAADMAAAMGGDVVSATRQLARALEDPINGVTALTRSGTVFTREQRDMIRAMVESGRTAEAQAFILSELEAQYGGVARAAGGLTAAKDSLGQSVTNLLVSLNGSIGLNDKLAAAYNWLADSVQWLADNTDVLRGYIIAAATAITAYYIPAIVAVIYQNGLWIASLINVRRALISIGIGAFIFLAGTAVNWLIRLREETGSWGEAFTLIGETASEVFAAIVDGSKAVPIGLRASWDMVRAGFFGMVADLRDAWNSFLNMFGQGVNAIAQFAPGPMGVAARAVQGMLRATTGDIDDLRSRAVALQDQARIGFDMVGTTVEIASGRISAAMGRLRDAMSSAVNDADNVAVAVRDLNNALAGAVTAGAGPGGGTGGADDGFAGRLAALAQQFQTERDMVEQWYQEAQAILADRRAQEILGEEEHRRLLLQVEELYQQQLAAIRANAQAAQLGHTADFFGAMAEVAQQGGESMTRVARAFGAAQALINTYVAASQVLADPSLGFFAKFAAVARVIAAGMGLVNAIRGGRTSAASPSSASGVTQQQTPLRRTIVELRGPDWVKGIIQPIMEQIYDASRDGEKVIFAR